MSRRIEALVVGACAAGIYVLTLSGNHSETEDSVAFAVRVQDDQASDLIEGTHVVYLPLGRVFAQILAASRLTDDPLLALQVLDALLAGAAVAGLWLLLRRAGCSRLATAGASGTVAFSYAFWRNAVDVEVYALSALALVGAFAAAFVAASRPRTQAFAILGLANGVAVLAHVTNVLFAAVAGITLVIGARNSQATVRMALRWSVTFAGAVAAIVVPAYGVAAVVHGLSSPSEFWRWFTERSGRAGDFGTFEVSNVNEAIIGSGRALVGGHFAFALEPIRESLSARFSGKTFSEELFFLAGFSDGLAIALLVLAVVIVLLAAVLAAQWLRRPTLDPRQRVVAILAAVWLAAYAVVFLWWDPLNIEFWYAVWVPAGVLIALPAGRLGSAGAKGVVLGLVALLLVVNALGSVLPQRDEARDLWFAKTAWYRQHARSDDLVVANGYIWSAYLRYHVEAEVVDIEDLFREAATERGAVRNLRLRLDSSEGRRLVSGEAFHAFADRRAACIDAPRTCAIAEIIARELQDECDVLAFATSPPERVWHCPRTA